MRGDKMTAIWHEYEVSGLIVVMLFDSRIFYPHASSYRTRSLPSLYRKFEADKKREYSERINSIEHGSFTPLVFSACGGMEREATVVIKRLADALSVKRNECYSHTISWMRCCLSFSLARSAIRCLRGSRSVRRWFDRRDLLPVDLVRAEANFDLNYWLSLSSCRFLLYFLTLPSWINYYFLHLFHCYLFFYTDTLV